MKIRGVKFNRPRRRLHPTGEKGLAMAAAVICVLLLTILGLSMLIMANDEVILVQNYVNRTKAFYLAEAGVEVLSANLSKGVNESITETALGEGSYHVDFNSAAYTPYAIATGTVGGQEKKIKVTASFLAPPLECGIYAGGNDGMPGTFTLRGTGSPASKSGGEVGGKDIINGNVFVDGNVALYQESCVRPPVGDNPFGLKGDVKATGDVNLFDSATVSGKITRDADPYGHPDLVGMNYAVNNTHNVSQIFKDANVTSGYLPEDNELRDVFVINPTKDRKAECDNTPGDDYFLEPVNVTGGGTYKDSTTPLHLGNDRVYYVDGDVWVHSKPTYGFMMDGKVTIVATGNIHISDNLQYKDSSSMLGLVALGKYDEDGKLVSGGNIYFGDPRYGTTYVVSGMMFAANNFLYNTDAIGRSTAEPESGFIVNGSFAALNEVSVERDWYTRSDGTPKPARYDLKTKKWYDATTGVELTSTQISTLRHYQMIVNYDDRVRSQRTQPPGLPRGTGTIFEGLRDWQEL
jgi:roadblock/LC7 domain-containing protein